MLNICDRPLLAGTVPASSPSNKKAKRIPKNSIGVDQRGSALLYWRKSKTHVLYKSVQPKWTSRVLDKCGFRTRITNCEVEQPQKTDGACTRAFSFAYTRCLSALDAWERTFFMRSHV